MRIVISQMTKDCKALGAYLFGSMSDGEGKIMIDFDGVESESTLSDEDKKHIIVDAIKHEIHHALSEYFGVELEDPDGMCGGTDTEVMVVVPLEEHEAIVNALQAEIDKHRWILTTTELPERNTKVQMLYAQDWVILGHLDTNDQWWNASGTKVLSPPLQWKHIVLPIKE